MGTSFGLIVPNRAVVLGAVTAKDLVDLAMQGEASGAFDTVWVGASLLAKPHLEVEGWTAAGSSMQCIEELQAYVDAGVQHVSLRLISWDQRGQLKRFLNEVAPVFSASGRAEYARARGHRA
jgi:alkanesulfonate monooxygenase SsuD/methylene tetrahydromethanopterin reductase-like flavin-dependent oxidoreductase (luciferase family)